MERARHVAFLLVMAFAGCTEPPHLAVGSWEGDGVRVVVFPDHVATVNNLRCSWVPADYWSIRLELMESQTEESLFAVASELRVTEGTEGNRVRIDLLWRDPDLMREDPAAGL